MTVQSVHNPRIQAIRKLSGARQRREAGLFLAEGSRLAQEALQSGLCETLIAQDPGASETLVALAEEQGCEVLFVTRQVMESICDTKTPQTTAALCRFPDLGEPRGRLLLALDAVQNPGNVGTMIRTADAAGLDGVLLGPGCADPYSPKVIASAMGSVLHLPVKQTENLASALAQLQESGMNVIASELGGENFFGHLPPLPCVLVIGNEGNGISREVSQACTCHLALPMPGRAESLNAAVAAGIMMYELAQRAEGIRQC